MAYDPSTASYGNMLDWLIPQQLRHDIQSMTAGPRGFGRDLYKKSNK